MFMDLAKIQNGVSRAITGENRTGEKGKGGMAESAIGPGRKGNPCIFLKAGETTTLAEINHCGTINHIWITCTDQTTQKDRFVLRDLVLRMYWDGEETPSVESPLGDFFCMGFGESYTVNSMLVNVNPLRGMNCYFSMPFRKGAKITIENQHANDIDSFFFQIDYCICDELPLDIGYFHAKWNREKITEIGKDYTIIDNIKGKGHYIGTFLEIAALERYWYGEGEVKFYMDGDVKYPTICGTGEEDYFGGAWSFANIVNGECFETTYNSMFLGYPFFSNKDRHVTSQFHNRDCATMRCFYRWHYFDAIRFEKNLRVTIQQIGSYSGGLFERQDDVASVAYWYQVEPHAPFSALSKVKDRTPR